MVGLRERWKDALLSVRENANRPWNSAAVAKLEQASERIQRAQ